MLLHYALVKNQMIGAPGTYFAVIQNNKSIDISQVIDEMIREGSGLTRPQAMAYNERLFQIIENYAAQGYRVNLPVASIYASIKGIFDGIDDQFDKSRHQVRLQVAPNKRLRAIEKKIKVKKVAAASILPAPKHFFDLESGKTNDIMTPGGIVMLRGTRLKFSPEDPQQGVFLIPQTSKKDVIQIEKFSLIKPSELIFQLPKDLKLGLYQVEIRVMMRGHTQLREGVLSKLLSVG